MRTSLHRPSCSHPEATSSVWAKPGKAAIGAMMFQSYALPRSCRLRHPSCADTQELSDGAARRRRRGAQHASSRPCARQTTAQTSSGPSTWLGLAVMVLTLWSSLLAAWLLKALLWLRGALLGRHRQPDHVFDRGLTRARSPIAYHRLPPSRLTQRPAPTAMPPPQCNSRAPRVRGACASYEDAAVRPVNHVCRRPSF